MNIYLIEIYTRVKKNNRSKYDLIDMIITEKDISKKYSPEDDHLTQEEAQNLLNNNNFAKPKTSIKPDNL